jgi:manganese/iron transport system permease protein
MIEFLLSPFAYAFMQRALVAVLIVGTVSAIIGTYVVLRGLAFFGDALSHSILPGVAVGYLVQGGDRGAVFWWALGTAIVTSLAIGNISKNTKIREDTAIGILFAGMFALGIALISSVRVRNYTTDLTHFLFGEVLGVGAADLWRMGIFGGLVLLAVFAFYKEFLVLSFDPTLAATLRLPMKALDYLLFILIAITIVVSLQTVGVALMIALLITPAATASLLTNRLPVMMGFAAAISAFSSVIGLYLSYHLNIASGSAIVLTATAVFLVVFVLKRK